MLVASPVSGVAVDSAASLRELRTRPMSGFLALFVAGLVGFAIARLIDRAAVSAYRWQHARDVKLNRELEQDLDEAHRQIRECMNLSRN